MAYSTDGLNQLTGLIYDAVLDPTLWHEFLRVLCLEMETPCAQFWFLVKSPQSNLSTYCYGFDQRTIDEWQKPGTTDPWAGAVTHTGASGLSHHVCPDEKLIATEYHDRILAPANLFYGAAIVVLMTGEIGAGLSVLRSRSDGPLDERAVDYLNQLFPHLNRAARMQIALNANLNHGELAFSALDGLSSGIVIVDAEGRVLNQNQAALSVLESGDPLVIANGFARATRSTDRRRLSGAIRNAVVAAESGAGFPATSVLLRRNGGRPPLIAMVSALRSAKHGPFALPAPRAMLLLRDLATQAQPSASVLQDLFSFTPTECAIASELHRGESLQEIASNCGISLQTVRTHVKRMLQKSGTHRQSQLVSLLARLTWSQ